jgi:hypothetical protein
VIGLLLIAAAVATAGLAAAAIRLPSLVSTILVGYLALVANAVVVTVALSPFRDVTRGGLAAAEAALFVVALAGWWLRGRPGLPLGSAHSAVREVAGSPLTVVFLGVVAVVLGYELVLALTVPPNNWDALNYHLARVASWMQHGGIYWIPNTPTDILNTRQPVAEQEILFLFVATGKGALFALPQYLAELAVLVAVYGSSRRLGFGVRPSVCGAALLATFSLFALEATTAQNDLVAASFPVVAACLILGRSRTELALGGAAVGMGIGVKLTTALVWPVLAWLTLTRGRNALKATVAGAVGGFAAIGMWGYLLNLQHTGRILGQGRVGLDVSTSPSYPRSVVTGLDVLYEAMDLSVLSHRVIDALALTGFLAAVAVSAYAVRRARPRLAIRDAARVAIPFLAPLIVIGAGGTIAFIARTWGFPIRGRGGIIGSLTHTVNEDFSAFGPLGAVALAGVVALTARAYVARRIDAAQLALAAALPSFLIFMSLGTKWNAFLPRFLLVPAVLTAPLLARLFRDRATTAAYIVVAAVTIGLTITHVQSKPLSSTYGRPWHLTRVDALGVAGDPNVARALAALDRLVPARACVGAVLGPAEPSYLLWGAKLERRVLYLSVNHGTVLAAYRAGLFYVVISTGRNRWVAGNFRSSGWIVRPLGRYWLLAAEPHTSSSSGTCRV